MTTELVSPRVPAHPHRPRFERVNPWSRCQRSSPRAFQVSPVRMKYEGSNHLKETYTNRSEVPPWSDARARGDQTSGSTLLEIPSSHRMFQKGGRVWMSP